MEIRPSLSAASRRCFCSSKQGAYEMLLHGKIVKGCGAASFALPKLLPIIEREYDELCGAHPGTINVDVGEPINLKIDFKTDKIIPDPPHLHRVEFVRVQFEFPLGTCTKAWIYQPYGYHWGCRNAKSIVEVLVSKKLQKIELEPEKDCSIHVINKGCGSSSTSLHYLNEQCNRSAN
jgi:hypothetical protein